MGNSSIKKNFLMNYLVTGMNLLFPMVTVPLVTRALGAPAYGEVAFFTSTISLFQMFSMLGVGTYGIRACAQVRDDPQELDRVSSELLALTLASTVLVYLALLAAVLAVPRLSEDPPLLLIMSLSILFNTLSVSWYINALEKYSYLAKRTLFVKLVSLACIVIFVHAPQDYLIYAGILVFATGAANLFNFYLLVRERCLFKDMALDVSRHIRPALAFLLLAVFTSLYTQVDTVMLGFMASSSAVACYSLAAKLKGVIVSVSTSLTNVVLPRASNLLAKDEEAFIELAAKTMEAVVAVSLPVGVIMCFDSEYVIAFFGGEDFAGAADALRIVSVATIPIALSNVLNSDVAIPLGRESVLKWVFLSAGLLDIALNLFAIPVWGATGAAASTFASELVVFGCLLVLAGRRTLARMFVGCWKALLSAALAAGFFVILLKIVGDGIVMAIAGSLLFLIVYASLIFASDYAGIRARLLRRLHDNVRQYAPHQG